MAKVSIIDWIVKKLKRCIAIVEDGDTASQAIASGKYVIWKGNAYKASTAISQGDTLSLSNLTAVSDGIGNELNSNLETYSKIYYKDFDLSSVTVNTGAIAKIAVDITQTGKYIIGAIVISQTSGTSGAFPYFAVAPAPWGLFVFNTYSQQLTSALKVRVFYVDVVSAI